VGVAAEATKTRFKRPQQRRGRLIHDFGAAGVSAEATKTRFKRPQQRRGRLKHDFAAAGVPAEATKTRFKRPQQRRGRLKHDFGAAGVPVEATKTRFQDLPIAAYRQKTLNSLNCLNLGDQYPLFFLGLLGHFFRNIPKMVCVGFLLGDFLQASDGTQ